jgi:hypothetical protein
MRRRKLLPGAVAVLVTLAGVAALVLWPRADRVTRANFDRIRVGMSRAEVEAILGPPGDYRTGRTKEESDPRELMWPGGCRLRDRRSPAPKVNVRWLPSLGSRARPY